MVYHTAHHLQVHLHIAALTLAHLHIAAPTQVHIQAHLEDINLMQTT